MFKAPRRSAIRYCRKTRPIVRVGAITGLSRTIGADSSRAIRIDVMRKMSVGCCCWINIDRCRYVDVAVIRAYMRLLYTSSIETVGYMNRESNRIEKEREKVKVHFA